MARWKQCYPSYCGKGGTARPIKDKSQAAMDEPLRQVEATGARIIDFHAPGLRGTGSPSLPVPPSICSTASLWFPHPGR